MRMNSLKMKKVLSLLRAADFAHAGEAEAIDIAFMDIPKDAHRLMLDVGCGLGGTAEYLRANGWGNVIGVDINLETIQYAKEKYSDITFHLADVLAIENVIKQPVDLIYMFNVFYCLPHQMRALAALKKVAKKNAQLVLFDYTDKGYTAHRPPADYDELLSPVNLNGIEGQFLKTGWKIIQIKNLDKDYERWYQTLVDRIVNNKENIIQMVGKEGYDYMHDVYFYTLSAIKNSYLGGAVVASQYVG